MTGMIIEQNEHFAENAREFMNETLAYAARNNPFDTSMSKEEYGLTGMAVKLAYEFIDFIENEGKALRQIQENQIRILEELGNLKKMIDWNQVKTEAKIEKMSEKKDEKEALNEC